jgi:PAS domain S-box-containing protein
VPDRVRGASPHAEEVFRRVVEEASEFAIILLDERGLIETWNAGAERMFGWTQREVRGRDFSFIFTGEDRRNGQPEKELATARAEGHALDVRWHVRKDGRRVFTDGTTTAIRADDGSLIAFSKIARDATDRVREEQRLATQLALTTLLNEQQPYDITIRRVMETICVDLGWDVGAFWHVDAIRATLRCEDVWHAPTIDDAFADELCGHRVLRSGEGLPGAVLATGKPQWPRDLFNDMTMPRAALLERSGLVSAFAFPVTLEGRVIAVIEFFSREPRELDQSLLRIMELIGAQLGDYIVRRRGEQALRDSEERYRVVSETAQDAFFTIDADSNILYSNAAVERMFGYAPAELVGQPLSMLMPERMREQHRRGIQRYLQTHEKHIPWNGVELPGLRKDGRELPLEISFGEWREDDRVIFTGFARDITERKRAREEMQRLLADEQRARAEAEGARGQIERRVEEEASFRHLASALTGAVEMTDVLYEITNRATLVTRADGVYVERIVGPSRQVEVVSASGRGTPPRGLKVDFPGSMTQEILQRGQPVILADISGFGRSMAPYLVDTCANCEVLVTPLIAEEEPLGALVLLNSGASGRHFTDSDLVRARTLGDLTSLALRRVRLMEQEREAKEKAEAAVRVRDETLGIVSHDLRNPLTKIALSADLFTDATEEERPELLETIRVASKQMQRLIQDLLDVARVEASGRLSVDMKAIDAKELVLDACSSHEPIAAQKRQQVVCNVQEPLPQVCADRDRIMQVFGNLVGNAIKFTPERGTITIETFANEKEVTFRVRDSGPGISEADVKNVFRPYWQAKKTAHMGAGLGLAIVRGIIEAHGGRVWAENAPEGGAQFTFTIPAV